MPPPYKKGKVENFFSEAQQSIRSYLCTTTGKSTSDVSGSYGDNNSNISQEKMKARAPIDLTFSPVSDKSRFRFKR